MGGVTRLTGLTSLDLGSNELSADDGAYVCGAAAGAGMTRLAGLELGGNGFDASSVVGCEGWREAGLPQAGEEFCSLLAANGYDVLIQYALSRDRAAFAARYHPLLPAALLRRIESSDPSLTSVDVRRTAGFGYASQYIGSSRVACLAEALSLNTCITSLNVAGNKLGSGGLRTLMGGVTRLTGLTSLDLGRNELSADDGAYVCGAAAGAGMTRLAALELGGNGFDALSVVGCEGWREAGLCCSSDHGFVPISFDELIQYAVSSDRIAYVDLHRRSLLPAQRDVIFISGANGGFSYGINGPYDRTAVKRGGYAVYMKRGDGSMCIEHQNGKWKVRHVSDKGQEFSFAAKVSGNCALEECASRTWSVRDSISTRSDQLLKITLGEDAQREVTHPPLHAPAAPPFPTPLPPISSPTLPRLM